jgi:hypothetical protein
LKSFSNAVSWNDKDMPKELVVQLGNLGKEEW